MTRLVLISAIALVTLAAGAAPAAATFPGANGKIAFDSDRTSFEVQGEGTFRITQREIYAMNPDGSDQQQLTETGCNADPAWSPDGTKILFVRAVFEFPGPEVVGQGGGFTPCEGFVIGEIWVMNADGSGQTPVTTEANDSDPSWSPDGTKILFRRSSECQNDNEVNAAEESGGFSQSDIWMADADGNNQENLTEDERCLRNKEPAWAPDGSKIAFTSDRDDERWQIFLMNPDGSGVDNISEADADDDDPDWSPDSARLTFRRDGDISLMDRDGGNQAELPGAEVDEKQPVWSPDGTKLSYAARADQTDYLIHVSNTVGGDLQNLSLVEGPASSLDVNPNWQPVARSSTTPTTPTPPPGATTPPPDTPAARRDRRRPRVRVAGIAQGCTASSALRVPVRINERVRRVGVRLDGRRILRTSRRRFTLVINARRLRSGRHTLRVVAVDAAGNRTTLRRPIVRCAQAAPQQAPHFTG